MSSATTISEIKTLISDPEAQVTTKTGLRLLLTVSSEMWTQMEQFNATLNRIVEKERQHDTDIAELKSHNILMWVGKNPKSAVAALGFFIIAVDMFVDLVSWQVATDLIYAVFKKLIGG